jgi:hypothetical protein
MQVTTATPVEIDTELARLGAELAVQYNAIDRAMAASKRLVEGRYYDEVRDAEQLDSYNRKVATATWEAGILQSACRPFDAEFTRRGGWTRYYLVEGGHLHYDVSGHRCSRIPSTSHYWLTEQSGKSAAEVIELAGERVCTVCFPDAPVAVQERPSQLLTKTEAEQAEARAEREQKRSQAAATKAAKAITAPDGSPLVVSHFGWTETLKTEAAAQSEYRGAIAEIAALEDSSYAEGRPKNQTVQEHEEHRARIIADLRPRAQVTLEALAAKHGVTVEEETERHAKAIATKVRKDLKEAAEFRAQFRAQHPDMFV